MMGPGRLDLDNIARRFRYHAPTPERAQLHHNVREACEMLATYLAGKLPGGRELNLAITSIEEAMFWANAAIARKPH